ncbi:alpha/beta-hydrolase [Pholiota conissans]|uniref:Alpha/beta-hydrolase n=1 Tax=Pholiota conissans TaxID=109636 RepID=A0A9P6D3I3_9AGAR|nr:alpha/beta-hydrolase [Pholiota conissans]
MSSTPLVIVQGFLGTAEIISWGRHINTFGQESLARRKILLPNLGPVSSLHDRACELYYSLAGGTVDYGKEHSSAHNHARYGRTFPVGLYPPWSKEHPLHFVGHSVGGPTVIKLQYLLQEGHFGKEGHPEMVLSLNAVCSPFRGTQLVYTLGEEATAAPDVRPFSLGALLAKFIHLAAYLSPLLPSVLDMHADARALSYRESSLISFGKQLWSSDWAASTDAVPYDMTFEASDIREIKHGEGRPHQNTFYRSHVSCMLCYHHEPPLRISSITHILLYFWSQSIGSFDYRSLKPAPSFLGNFKHANPMNMHQKSIVLVNPLGEEHWANDGVVPVFSQWHPLPCGGCTYPHPYYSCPPHLYSATTCSHDRSMSEPSSLEIPLRNASCYLEAQLISGCWVVRTMDGSNHLSLIPRVWGENTYQRDFWVELGQWLDAVDKHVNICR